MAMLHGNSVLEELRVLEEVGFSFFLNFFLNYPFPILHLARHLSY